MTIAEAACEVLKRHGQPMTIDEIYEAIKAGDLFEFKADQPRNVLRSQIRRHCQGVMSAAASTKKYFAATASAKFALLED